MSDEITDHQLQQLIEGKLSSEEEGRLENLLSLDAGLRMRLDRLCGGDEWSIGAAPLPPAHSSARLSIAIEQVERYVLEGSIAPSTAPSTTASATSSTSPDLSDLPTLSGIKLVRQIGQGGMGVVYEGIDEALGRRVAVKFIQPMRAASPEAQERLVREAKATAALHHENIVTIHSIQTINGTPALIQQFIDGPTLQEVLDSSGALPIERCLDLARQLTQGLAAAHAAGIVHRDLKPGNVLIDKQTGKARLADFGMAKHIADLHLSSPDIVSGTPAYMSPEQSRGEPTDGRSDLFSLGAILYTAIAGRAPFQGEDPFVVMDQVRSAQQPLLASVRPESPSWLNALVEKLLAKRPEHRIASADELLKLLDISSNRSTPSRVQRGLVVTALCLLVSVGAYYGWLQTNQRSVPGLSQSQLQSQTQSLSGSASAASAVSAADAGHRLPQIWIGDPNRTYATLQSAVKDARDGDVITIASDLTTEQVDIVGKRLTIRAAPGTKPIIRPNEWAVEHSPFLFRANRDLTVSGLNIDWQVKTEPLTEPGATITAIIAVTQPEATLQIEDCVVQRTQGICVATVGNMKMRGCKVSGGQFALGWVANNSHLEVSQSVLDCESSLVVLYPPANATFRENAAARFEKCTFSGQGMIDFVLFRHAEHPIELVAEECVFDVERMVQLSGTTIIANFNWEWVAQAVAKSCVRWHESDCEHREGIDYIASRRLRGPNRWKTADVRGLEAWQKFWSTQDPSSVENPRRQEVKTAQP